MRRHHLICWEAEKDKKLERGKILFELGHWFSLPQDWNFTSNSSGSQAFKLRLELHSQLALLGVQPLKADCGTSHHMSQLLKQTNKWVINIIYKNIFYMRWTLFSQYITFHLFSFTFWFCYVYYNFIIFNFSVLWKYKYLSLLKF